MSHGVLERIWIKRAHRGVMDPAERANVIAGRGLAGSANQGGRRQIAIVDADAWRRACQALGRGIDPIARRANLLVSGLELAHTRGRVLHVGAVRMRVFAETKPCDRMDQVAAGLRAALRPEWRAGISVQVLDDGEIALGDAVRFEDG